MRARKIGSNLSRQINAGPSVKKTAVIEVAGVAMMARPITAGGNRSETVCLA